MFMVSNTHRQSLAMKARNLCLHDSKWCARVERKHCHHPCHSLSFKYRLRLQSYRYELMISEFLLTNSCVLDEQKDPSVEKALQNNNDVVQAKELSIKAKNILIAALREEQRRLHEAAAMFSIYLKRISITPYNDATLEYLHHLIKEEREKVGYGGDQTRLESLEKDREEYATFVKTMTMSIDSGKGYKMLDEEGVYELVDNLYKLKHSGGDLKVSTHALPLSPILLNSLSSHFTLLLLHLDSC